MGFVVQGSCAVAPRMALLPVAAWLGLASCASTPPVPDRTEGLGLEYLWASADEGRVAYYEVARDGTFRSSGGLPARRRVTTYECALSPDDARKFVVLVRATDAASRPASAGDAGETHELRVRDGSSSVRFELRGTDEALEALRAWCAGVALRQYRDVLDAQPEAGPRSR